MANPTKVEIHSPKPATEQIEQFYYEVEENEKMQLLDKLLYTLRPDSAIIFCNTREKVDFLVEGMKKTGYSCGSLHGGMEQRERLQTMESFKRGEFQFLVATDVAARGIHVDDIALVINFELPFEKENYVHRIGRTGRAGNAGMAVTFVAPREQRVLQEIEQYVEYEIPGKDFPTLEEVQAGKKIFAANRLNKTELKPNKSEQLNKEITRIRINGGKKTKMRPGDILGAITNISGISAADIGIIDIQDTCSYVEIIGANGRRVLEALPDTKIKGKIYTSKQVACRSM